MNRKASITFQPRRFAVSEVAAKRKSQNRVGVRVCSLAHDFRRRHRPGRFTLYGPSAVSSRFTATRPGERKAAACLACHGVAACPLHRHFRGFAGQRADYLYHRLVSFKHAEPQGPVLFRIADDVRYVATLSDTDMRDLAVYFASQTPTAANATATAAAPGNGEALFLAGDPARGDSALPGMPRRRCARALDQHRSICALSVAARAERDVFVARLTSFHKQSSRMTPRTTSSWVVWPRRSMRSRFKRSPHG